MTQCGIGLSLIDGSELSEFAAWNDLDAALDVAQDSGWFVTEDGVHHYCPDCYTFDYDDNLVIDQKRTNYDTTK